MKRARRMPIPFVVALLLLAATLPLSVSASNWVNRKASDTSTVRFQKCSLTTSTNDAFNSNDSHDIEPTDINTSISSTCDTIDVRINDADYGKNGKAGWYECHSTLNRRTYTLCDQGHAHINQFYSSPRLYVVCQEIGHSVSLQHSDQGGVTASCMNDNTSQYHHLADHDKNHLNNLY